MNTGSRGPWIKSVQRSEEILDHLKFIFASSTNCKCTFDIPYTEMTEIAYLYCSKFIFILCLILCKISDIFTALTILFY